MIFLIIVSINGGIFFFLFMFEILNGVFFFVVFIYFVYVSWIFIWIKNKLIGMVSIFIGGLCGIEFFIKILDMIVYLKLSVWCVKLKFYFVVFGGWYWLFFRMSFNIWRLNLMLVIMLKNDVMMVKMRFGWSEVFVEIL